mgnify:CR=1 FL=1
MVLKTKNIFLLRHGKTLGAAALNGKTDVLVDELVQQRISDALAKHECKFDAIISSPLMRCSDLAKIHSKLMDIPLEMVPELQEMDFGDVDGIPFDLLKNQWSMLESFWQDPANHHLSGAESLHSFQKRVISGWSHVLDIDHDNLLVVTHGGVIRVLLAHLLGVDWQNPRWYSNLAIANASITHIQVTQTDQTFISVKSIGSEII